ncbi:MAG: hypothetical protein SWK90_20520, partial [Chloroflexota bacterium]|nr:hypothetical protein [Chloroflexota bacterium]
TMRHTIILLLILILPLGLVSLVATARPAVAEPISITPLPPVQEVDGRAGACYSFYYDPPEGPDRPFISMVYNAGSRWDRFDFIWPNIEPTNDGWNFGAYDAVVNDLDAAGMNMVGILLWTPDWAATSGLGGISTPRSDQRSPGWHAPAHADPLAPLVPSAASSPPQGLYLSWNDPNNHWGNYVYTVVSRYKDRVKHWEMWNEPEWSYFWTGTSTDYAQLLKVGYQATKAACPDCTVLFGGLHYWLNTDYYKWVLNVLDDDPAAPQNNYFFDVMSVHLYSRSSNTYDEVNNIRAGMSAYGVGDHPIWLTETGVPVWGDGLVGPKPKYDYAATQDEAAAYVIQSYANSWASDVERYFFFRTHDADMGEYFGLIRNDHSLRPAYVAYQVATTYLVSPSFTTRVISDSDLNVTLWGTPRGKVSVLWNESPTTGVYTLPAAMPTATLVDRWGVTETTAATGDVYTFTLPGATANRPFPNQNDYIIGGDPLIVIETETPSEPPTSTVHSLPEVTYSPAFTVTWEGQDNQSGVWVYDVQVRDGDGGEWDYWQHSSPATSGQFTGQHDHTYYFRSRATDKVGNREVWPEDAQAYATLDLSSTLHLSIGTFFADENRDDIRDISGTLTTEITLTQVALRFLDEAGQDVVSPTVDSSSWAFTTTIYAGQTYQLRATSADHERILSLTWPRGGEVYVNTYLELGLWPVRRRYLPLVLRGG